MESAMPDLQQIATRSALVFDCWIEGPASGSLVLLLHGFPQSRHTWRHQLPALAAAGFRAIAPDQRGYSPGARPDPAVLDNYQYDRLIGDVLDLAAACGCDSGRFHLVGHDWGGQVAWGVADRHPDRLASLTILSRPHPASFLRALQAPDSDQKHRSRHHRAFLDPSTAQLLLEEDARRLRQNLRDAGVPEAAAADYVSVLGTTPAMEAALAWYRAQEGLRAKLGMISVPTLYLWGDADATVGRLAAEGTAEFVSGPFQFRILEGIGHFITDQTIEPVNTALLAHFRAFPAF
jgi:pimeloyl-ACP methyl ester carboxylesterase